MLVITMTGCIHTVLNFVGVFFFTVCISCHSLVLPLGCDIVTLSSAKQSSDGFSCLPCTT